MVYGRSNPERPLQNTRALTVSVVYLFGPTQSAPPLDLARTSAQLFLALPATRKRLKHDGFCDKRSGCEVEPRALPSPSPRSAPSAGARQWRVPYTPTVSERRYATRRRRRARAAGVSAYFQPCALFLAFFMHVHSRYTPACMCDGAWSATHGRHTFAVRCPIQSRFGLVTSIWTCACARTLSLQGIGVSVARILGSAQSMIVPCKCSG